jgi:catechol 2,3-dioxygenase-like lactoylglutathione lyase family enzyme
MDQDWIVTLAAPTKWAPQIPIASEGGSGTLVPDISVELDDLDEALRRVRALQLVVEYGPTSEPWHVRRFYVRDPLGRLVNILVHE